MYILNWIIETILIKNVNQYNSMPNINQCQIYFFFRRVFIDNTDIINHCL